MRLGDIEHYNAKLGSMTVTPVPNKARFRHTYVIGKPRTGKSTALIRWAIADIRRGRGIAFFDPHRSSIDTLLNYIPPTRIKDIILIDLMDRDFPTPLNFLAGIDPALWEDMASAVTDTFKTIWHDSWGPQLEVFVFNTTAALIQAGGTILDISRMLTDDNFRKRTVQKVTDPIIKDYWEREFTGMPDRERRERILSTLNKVGRLAGSPVIRNAIGQKDTLDFKDILDGRKILLVSFPPGRTRIKLLGSLLLSRLYIAAQERATRRHFHIYLDEAQFFGSQLIDMLTDLPKLRVSLVLANQYLAAFEQPVRDAILGTVGRVVAFRTSAEDADTLASHFEFERDDTPLPQLPPYRAYTNSDEPIDGRRTTALMSMPETNSTLHPKSHGKVRAHTRRHHATPRAEVEKDIARALRRA